MDGVFINLTDTDVTIITKYKSIVIEANPDLITPIIEQKYTKNDINGIISTSLSENDIKYLHGTNWISTLYNKITRSEEKIVTTAQMINPYVKYPFTKEQIDKINKISNKRTRLFILTKEDAEYWSSGKFECPFRNYRLFTVNDNTLYEYAIPKTYLDSFVESIKNISDRFN